MKRIILSAAVLVSLIATQEAQAQQGFGTNLPHKSSVIELQSSKKGLLIPRVDIENLGTAAPVTSPATSLLVYNTNKTTGEGFYYWDSAKWVRFSTSDTDLTAKVEGKDSKVTVTEATSGNVTTYTVGVDETKLNINNLDGKLDTNKIVKGTEGQLLVTKTVGGDLVPAWVDASEVTGAITGANGLTKNATTSAIELGGTLTRATEITTDNVNTLAIKGLQGALKGGTEEVVVMGADGILKKISKKDLIETAIDAGNLEAKTLKGDGITVTAGSNVGTGTQVGHALLKDVTLGIANNAITSAKIKNGTIEAEDMKSVGSNKVLVTSSSGTVMWADKSAVAPGTGNLSGESGVITVTNGNGAVLKNVEISIASSSIGSDKLGTDAVTEVKIADGAVTPKKIKGEATNNGKVMTTKNGEVQWIDPKTLVSETKVVGGSNVSVQETGTNPKTYTVAVGLGNTLAAGVVRQASTNAEVVIAPVTGVLSLDKSNITVGGDLSGNIGSATVKGLQGREIANQSPANKQVLTFDTSTNKWTPKDLPAVQDVNEAINVKNGLSKDSGSDKDIILGGTLDRATTITTSTSNTLAIAGLQKVNTINKMVVVEDDGKLRTLERALVHEITASQIVSDFADYSPYVPQVDIYVTIGTANIDITLPAANSAKGQIITVKIANTTEPAGEHYVNISDVSGNTVSGQLPYQSWTIKSNGSKWSLVK